MAASIHQIEHNSVTYAMFVSRKRIESFETCFLGTLLLLFSAAFCQIHGRTSSDTELEMECKAIFFVDQFWHKIVQKYLVQKCNSAPSQPFESILHA